MSINQATNIEERLANDYTVNISQYFSEGWQVFKAKLGLFVMFTLVFLIICVATTEISKVGLIISAVVSPPLSAGFFLVAFRLRDQQEITFGHFFSGFSNGLIALIVASILSAILMILGGLLLIIPGIYLLVAYAFITPFIVAYQLDFWPAMEASRRIITKEWLAFFLLFIAVVLLNLAGLLALGLGLLFTIPWSYCIIAVAFDHIVGRPNSTGLDATEDTANGMQPETV